MSRRTKQAAMSRRTRRTDQQQTAPVRSTIVSNNPIFFCEDGSTRLKPASDLLSCGHMEPGSVRPLVLDDVPVAVGKPLPLPSSRTHLPAGSGRAGSALLMNNHGSGGVLWRVPRADPFLAAYVACAKSCGGKVDAAPASRQQRKKNKDKNRGDNVQQGCGIWSGWAAAEKYAGPMSCKYGSDAVAVQGGGCPSAASAQAQAYPVPRLHLSRQLVVIPARKRALVRARVQD